MKIPAYVSLFTEKDEFRFDGSERMEKDDILISIKEDNDALMVDVLSQTSHLSFLRLRWNFSVPADSQFIGDAWERSYGDLQWRSEDASRFMPWYFFISRPDAMLDAYGVRVQGGAMAAWTADSNGITLWLDLRCGTCGVIPGGRTIRAAEIIDRTYEGKSFIEASRAFCSAMCEKPILPSFPLYGGNNWYYAYGISSEEEILADSSYIAALAQGLANRPFMVIDDGWQRNPEITDYNGGPWHEGNERFPEMDKIAGRMENKGVRPGIWMRPLQNIEAEYPKSWFLKRPGVPIPHILDPSIPEFAAALSKDIARISDWGFQLLKHDFTTYDMFGQWGFEACPMLPAGDSWHFYDRSRTNAEIVKDLYHTIQDAAGDMIILGCNTIGHLGAGLMHSARTGDDTSGRSWERSRKMGVNTLAYRLGQHRTFFDLDADCVGINGVDIDWKFNRQWSEVLALSGTAFFVSVKPGVLSPAQFKEMSEFFTIASEAKHAAVPVEPLNSTTPASWLLDGKTINYDWYEDHGGITDFILNFKR